MPVMPAVSVTDYHTAGEPFRIVTAGLPEIVGATVLERQGVTILTADQHADFFIRNLIVVLFEERLGFPVFFPSAFVDLTLDTWSDVIGS